MPKKQAIRKLDLQGVWFFLYSSRPKKTRNIHENKETIQNE